jgi:hypothetical protein
MPKLTRVLRELHDSQIIAGLQTLSYGGVRLWLGDAMNATIAATTIDVARWLHETALRHFPDSKYARSHGH